MTTKLLLDNKAIKARVDDFLDSYFDRKITAGQNFGPTYQVLISRVKEFTLRGGKRLRPYMCYLGYSAAGGPGDPPVEILAAIELFHTSLLVHDDIMDRDLIRYGGPNISGMYQSDFKIDAAHRATSAAILAGDLYMALVQDLILSSDLDTLNQLYVLTSLAKQNQEVIAGQLMDSLPQPGTQASEADIIKIQLNKTAAYTTVGPLQIGAHIGGGSDELLAELTEYGRYMGLLFQTTDDILGIFGAEDATGKPNCTDLHENKPTMLFHYAKRLSTAVQLTLLESVLGKPHDAEEDISAVRDLLVSTGAKARVEQLALTYASHATQALGETNAIAFDVLRDLPSQLVHRIR